MLVSPTEITPMEISINQPLLELSNGILGITLLKSLITVSKELLLLILMDILFQMNLKISVLELMISIQKEKLSMLLMKLQMLTLPVIKIIVKSPISNISTMLFALMKKSSLNVIVIMIGVLLLEECQNVLKSLSSLKETGEVKL